MLPIILLVLAVSGAASAKQRIVNGEVVTPHSFPSQLSLQQGSQGSYRHICGAVLISSDIALTAAHCVYGSHPSRFRVQCGAHDLSQAEPHRQTSSVRDMRIHEYYNPSSSRPAFPNDIAILKLAEPFQMTHACYIVDRAKDGSGDYADQNVNITGWGLVYGGDSSLPSRLKEGFVEVLSPQKCYANYWGNTVDDNLHICVKDVGDRIYGSCNGDSGGPAYVRSGTLLVGITSFGVRGCFTHYPSVYVRVSNYDSWINRNMM